MTAKTLAPKPDSARARLAATVPAAVDPRTGLAQEWFSVADVVATTGASQRAVRRWVADGRLPAVKLGGRLLRIHRDDLLGMMAPRAATEAPPRTAVLPPNHCHCHCHCPCPCRCAATAASRTEDVDDFPQT
ncbi:MAG: helix-turn-helix domain-containing protein [Actinomycetia bacterium]|nr:helix-turn-helix domain-containing protein [Actinomycetes bacterium]